MRSGILIVVFLTALRLSGQVDASLLRDSLNSNPKWVIEQSSDWFKLVDDDSLKARLLEFKGLALHNQKKYQEAVEVYKEMISFAVKTRDTNLIFTARNKLTGPHFFLGNYTECFEIYFETYKMVENIEECEMRPSATLNLANMYYYLDKKDKCLEFQHRAQQLAIECSDTAVLQKSARNIAAIYTERGHRDSAIHWMKKGISFISPTDYGGLSNSHAILGGAYKYPEEKEQMYHYFNEGRKYALLSGDSSTIAFSYLKIVYFFLKEEQLDSAESLCLQALEIYRNQKLVDGIQHAMSYLEAVYEKDQNTEKALENMRALFRIRDTLLDEVTAIKTAELETRYETEKKEKENLKLKAENATKQAELAKEKNRRNVTLFGSVTALILMLGAGMLVFYRSRLKQKEALAALEREKTNAVITAEEKERVRVARELHDGIGQQLSGVKLRFSQLKDQLTSKLPEEEANLSQMVEVIDEACDDVRSISRQMMPRALQDKGLIPAIESMLDQSLGGSDIKFEFEHYKVDGRFESRIETSLYRICQELVNNIIKHSRATEIRVQLFRNKGFLIMIVEDNGQGFDTASNKEGIGLLNMSSRIDTINGRINFDSSPNSGTTATIRVPIIDQSA